MNKLTARTAKVLEKGNCDTDQCTNVSSSFHAIGLNWKMRIGGKLYFFD